MYALKRSSEARLRSPPFPPVRVNRTLNYAHRYSSFWPAGLPYPLFGRGHGFAVKYDLVRVLAQWENKLDCNGLEDVCTGVHIASDHVYEATDRQVGSNPPFSEMSS
jgi:hypothetical protein